MPARNNNTFKLPLKGVLLNTEIVIPKEAIDMFDIKPGDSVIVLSDKAKGIALVKADVIEDISDKIFPKGGE